MTADAVITSDQVIIFACAGLAAVALWWLVRRSRVGLEMRATVDRRELAALRSVDIARASRVAWMASSMMACLVGVAGGVVIGLLSDSYTLLLFAAAAAAVFGRLRSVPLAFIGGLLLGVAQNLVAGYLNVGFLQNVQGLDSSVPFLVLLVGLVVPGSGRVRQAGSLAAGRAGGAAATVLPAVGFSWRRLLPWAVFTVVAVVAIGFVASDYWTSLIVQGLVFAMVYLSLVVVTGVGGMVSLAQAAFVSVAGVVAGDPVECHRPQLPHVRAGRAGGRDGHRGPGGAARAPARRPRAGAGDPRPRVPVRPDPVPAERAQQYRPGLADPADHRRPAT